MQSGATLFPPVLNVSNLLKRSGKGENELTISSKFRHSGENRNPLVFNVFDSISLEESFFVSSTNILQTGSRPSPG